MPTRTPQPSPTPTPVPVDVYYPRAFLDQIPDSERNCLLFSLEQDRVSRLFDGLYSIKATFEELQIAKRCLSKETMLRSTLGAVESEHHLSADTTACVANQLNSFYPDGLLVSLPLRTIVQVVDPSEREELLRQGQVVFWSVHLCASKQEWSRNWGNVLNLQDLGIDALRCFVNRLGPDNTSSLFSVVQRADSPVLEHFSAGEGCGFELETLLSKLTRPTPTPAPVATPVPTQAPSRPAPTAAPVATPVPTQAPPRPAPTAAPVATPAPAPTAAPAGSNLDFEFTEVLQGPEGFEEYPRLSYLRGGTPVVLFFWFAGCPPCVPSMRLVDREYRNVGWGGLPVIGVVLPGDPERAMEQARELGLTFPIIYSGDEGISDRFGIQGVPTTILLDRNHQEVYRIEGTLNDGNVADFSAAIGGAGVLPPPPEAPTPLPTLAKEIVIEVDSFVPAMTEVIVELAAHEELPVRPILVEEGGLFARGEAMLRTGFGPMVLSERELAVAENNGVEFIEFPVALQSLIVLVSGENDFVECLSVQQLKALWEEGSAVTTWRDLNPSWPDEAIRLHGPAPHTEEFKFFTQSILGLAEVSRSDFSPSPDEVEPLDAVRRDRNALTYLWSPGVPLGDFLQSVQARAVLIDSGSGCVGPDLGTIQAGNYSPLLTRSHSILVNIAGLQIPEVAQFVDFYIRAAFELSHARGIPTYLPISNDQFETNRLELESHTSVRPSAPAPVPPGVGGLTEPGYGGAVYLAIGEEPYPESFSPFPDDSIHLKPDGRRVNSLIFSRLWRIGARGVEGDLVESWESSPDYRRWSLSLRTDTRFHDGRKVIAQDVAYSLEAMQKTWFTSNAFDVQLIDQYTLLILFEEPYAGFVESIGANTRAVIVPRGMLETPLDDFTDLIGSGPFIPERHERGSHIYLRRNPDYHEEGLPYLDQIQLIVIPERNVRLAAFRTGEFNFLGYPFVTFPPLTEEERSTIPNATFGSYPAVMALWFDTQSPPFDDFRVRMAVNLAIDRDALQSAVWAGSPQDPVPAALFPYWSAASDLPKASRDWHVYDPDRSKALLAEAGYPDGFNTVLHIPSVSIEYWGQFARAVSESLDQVGIRIIVQAGSYSDHLLTPADRGIKLEWASAPARDIERFFSDHLVEGGRYNHSRTAIEPPNFDHDGPNSILSVHRLLMEEVLYIPLPAPVYARSDRLEGPLFVAFTDLGTTLKQVWIAR